MITALFACIGARAKSVVISKDIMKQCFIQSGLKSDFEECCLNGLLKSSVKCLPGQYLPANAKKCSSCKDRYYACAGGFFVPSLNDQGIKKCLPSEIVSSDKIKCVLNCAPGQYLADKLHGCKACVSGYACPGGSGGINDLIKCKDNEIPNADKTKCVFNNITQETYNTDVLDYRNIDLSNMTEKDACLYWKGEWKDNTCILPHGTQKGRFKYSWDSANKKFMCLNYYELYLAGEYDDKEYADEVKKSIDKYPNKWKLAQWDPVIEECGSQHERDCRDAGNAWDWETAVCYDVSKNQSICESVGAKYKINADGSKSCDCVLSDREFHWKTREQSCYYTLKSWNGNDGSTGMISGSQYSTVESCINGLLKNNFFQNNKIEKLNCK